jgi:hypothetical protein
LEIDHGNVPFEQSDTSDEAGNTNSTVDSSGETEAPVKKAKIILTEKEQTFASLFSKVIDKIPRHVDKTGWCTNDVQELSLLPNTTVCSQTDMDLEID